jgi:hypothetical protein
MNPAAAAVPLVNVSAVPSSSNCNQRDTATEHLVILTEADYQIPIGPIKFGRPRGANLGSMGNNRRQAEAAEAKPYGAGKGAKILPL